MYGTDKALTPVPEDIKKLHQGYRMKRLTKRNIGIDVFWWAITAAFMRMIQGPFLELEYTKKNAGIIIAD